MQAEEQQAQVGHRLARQCAQFVKIRGGFDLFVGRKGQPGGIGVEDHTVQHLRNRIV